MMQAAAAASRPIDRAALVVVGGLGLIATSVLIGAPVAAVAPAVALFAAFVAWHKAILSWPALVGLLIAIILFIPVGRFSIPLGLPFGMELYRLAVAAVLAVWAGSLLVDPSVRLRRSPFDTPLLVVVVATLGSIVVNIGRVIPLEAAVIKAVTFFLSFVLVFYLIVSVVRARSTVVALTKFLVSGAAIVSVFAIVEQRTGFNVFDRIGQAFPFMDYTNLGVQADRYGLTRATGSSAHPIELGVLLALAVPLGLALVFECGRRWWIPTTMVAIGTMASASRTPILVSATAAIVLLLLRPRDVKRLLPLVVPLIVVVKLALPGSIATLKNAFFPAGGVVQEAQTLSRNSDPLLAGGRVRQLGPSLAEAGRTPLLGQGFATRQTGFFNPLRNAPILDNQWLGLLLELGAVGLAGWVALLYGAASRLGRASRRRAGPDGWLEAGLAASIAGFSIGMFTFDAFAFTQVTFIFWILLALGAALLLTDEDSKA